MAMKQVCVDSLILKGSYKSLYSAYNVVAYGRFTSDDAAIIIVNNNDDEVRARIPAWEVGLGFDDDLEWMYSSSDWTIYNHVVKRLIDEVMAGHRDTKTFSCSLHKVSYGGFDKAMINDVDFYDLP